MTFKSALIFALLGHRVLGQLLGASEWPLLVVSVAVDEVVALFLVLLLRLARLLRVIRAQNTPITVAHVALPGQLALSLTHGRVVFKVRLRDFHVSFLVVGFHFGDDGVRLVPKVVLGRTQRISVCIFLLLVE